jgi:hypothetical protein
MQTNTRNRVHIDSDGIVCILSAGQQPPIKLKPEDGNVLDVLVQSRRNTKAAKRFFRKLLTGLQYVPRVLVTDKLASYGVAHREIGVGDPPAVKVSEQPGREFSSAHPAA